MNKLPMPSTHIIRETSKYSGHLKVSEIELKHALFKGGWSRPIKREIVQRENAIAVLPYDPIKDSVVLIRQFRIGAWANKDHPFLWETVAGLIEKGETPEDVANRECAEEAGCTPVKLIKISSYYSSPGMLSEYIDFFCGIVDSSKAGGFHGLDQEDEDIEAKAIDWTEFSRNLTSGLYKDCKIQLGGYWLLANRANILRDYNAQN